MSIEKAQKILSRTGPKCHPDVNPDEELILWACSQAITYTGQKDWESALLILGGLLEVFSSKGENSQVWEDDDAIHAIEEVMGRTFYGAGGTNSSIYWLLEGDK